MEDTIRRQPSTLDMRRWGNMHAPSLGAGKGWSNLGAAAQRRNATPTPRHDQQPHGEASVNLHSRPKRQAGGSTASISPSRCYPSHGHYCNTADHRRTAHACADHLYHRHLARGKARRQKPWPVERLAIHSSQVVLGSLQCFASLNTGSPDLLSAAGSPSE